MLFLCAALFASAAVLLYYTRGITFLLDEWTFLLYRPGFNAHVVFDPHNEHIAVIPVLVYKALLELFGMDSTRPFQVASIATFLASAALLFAWLRGRVGEWAGAGRGDPGALPGRRLGGPAVAVSDRLLRLDGGGARDAARAAARRSPGRRHRLRAAHRVARLLQPRAPVRRRGGGGGRHRAATGGGAPTCSSSRSALFALWWLGFGHTAENHALARQPRGGADLRVRQHRRGDRLARRPGEPAFRDSRRRARLGPAARGAGAARGRLPHLPARQDPALALGGRRDRALLLGPDRVQPGPRAGRDGQPVPVRRGDLRPAGGGRACPRPAPRPAGDRGRGGPGRLLGAQQPRLPAPVGEELRGHQRPDPRQPRLGGDRPRHGRPRLRAHREPRRDDLRPRGGRCVSRGGRRVRVPGGHTGGDCRRRPSPPARPPIGSPPPRSACA